MMEAVSTPALSWILLRVVLVSFEHLPATSPKHLKFSSQKIGEKKQLQLFLAETYGHHLTTRL